MYKFSARNCSRMFRRGTKNCGTNRSGAVHDPDEGEPHSAFYYRAVGAARKAAFRTGSVISCGSRERVDGPKKCTLPWCGTGFGASRLWYTKNVVPNLRSGTRSGPGTPNATPLRRARVPQHNPHVHTPRMSRSSSLPIPAGLQNPTLHSSNNSPGISRRKREGRWTLWSILPFGQIDGYRK